MLLEPIKSPENGGGFTGKANNLTVLTEVVHVASDRIRLTGISQTTPEVNISIEQMLKCNIIHNEKAQHKHACSGKPIKGKGNTKCRDYILIYTAAKTSETNQPQESVYY